LLEVELKTGRTHQIRVHCASLGYPIAGDDKYGDYEWNRAATKAVPKLNRMFLHSHQFSFHHPVSGERMTVTAELAPELGAWWEGMSDEQ
jgi:23S rRNA pseudouridine955/2504/2580 synthase